MPSASEDQGFAVVRRDPLGEIPLSYLRDFTLAGRNGLQRLAFGGRSAAHVFDSRAEAEDIARRLRRRVSGSQYQYQVGPVERVSEVAEPPAAVHGRT